MAFIVDSGFRVTSALPADLKSIWATSASLYSSSIIPPASVGYISASWRYEGMKVYCVDDRSTYQLIGGVLDSNWVKLNSGSINISSSFAISSSCATDSISASYAKTARYALSVGTQDSCSWASSSFSSSHSLTASYFESISGSNVLYLQCTDGNTYQVSLDKDGTLITLNIDQTPVVGTNNFLQIGTVSSMSSSISASYALTASYALNGGGTGTQDSCSWASSSISASYLNGTASWAITASYTLNSGGGNIFASQSLYSTQSIYASSSLSASWASSSISSSYALTASYFESISGSNVLYLQCTDGNTYQVSLTTGSGVVALAVGQVPVTGRNNFLQIGTINESSSSISSSYAETASYAMTASCISGISGSNLLYLNCPDDGNTYPITLDKDGTLITLNVGQTPVTETNTFLNIGTVNVNPMVVSASQIIGSRFILTGSYLASITSSCSLTNDDNGMILSILSGSNIYLAVSSSLPYGFSCTIYQSGSGKATCITESGVSIRSRFNYLSTGGQYAMMSLIKLPNGDYVLTGDTSL